MSDPQNTQSFETDSELDTSQQLQAGTTLVERYTIQGIIGIGGMSAVYQARDMHFPNVTKNVAVKEMVNRALDPVVRSTIVRNFEREANLLASLEHRAIPRIYDYFTLNERSYLVIEFVSGSDLEELVNNTNEFIEEERLVRWAIELCDVLSYLHNHKPESIIFRDMKPSNVMINAQDHVVLVDFGIAKPFQAGKRGTMIGTEGYSPQNNIAEKPVRKPIFTLWAPRSIMRSLAATPAWNRRSPFMNARSSSITQTSRPCW
ncbi:MAG: serine/threonine protein kinase [Anaerolineales bacterium]|nr:serine/threonine protein kinase [Anaerolineales bacterium]